MAPTLKHHGKQELRWRPDCDVVSPSGLGPDDAAATEIE
jgi:hypothetical protein